MRMELIAADNLRSISVAPGRPDVATCLGERHTLSWTCVRRVHDAGDSDRPLEHLRLSLIVQPLDHAHALLEAWCERGGGGVGGEGGSHRSIQPPVRRPCTLTVSGGMLHLDMPGTNGDRLLSLTINLESRRVAYAQTTLLHDASFTGGTYDPPALQTAATHCIAQSA